MACRKEECGCVCNITGLAHIGVFVKDIQKSMDFYSDVLGFECYFEGDIPEGTNVTKVAFMRCGSCAIELVQLPVYQAKTGGQIDHIALGVDDIEAMMKCLTRKGVEFETKEPVHLPMIFDNGVKYVMFPGPDGERIELSQTL